MPPYCSESNKSWACFIGSQILVNGRVPPNVSISCIYCCDFIQSGLFTISDQAGDGKLVTRELSREPPRNSIATTQPSYQPRRNLQCTLAVEAPIYDYMVCCLQNHSIELDFEFHSLPMQGSTARCLHENY